MLRVNLVVPYSQKDDAKRAGARWDVARKVWFVENVENLQPFMRWMPEHLKKPTQGLKERTRRNHV